MSGNNTSGSSLPPGLASIAVYRPVLRSLLFTRTLLTLLIPLSIALFYYSTPQSRRQPIFVLNVFAIVMAFSIGALADLAGVHQILSPEVQLSAWVWIMSGIIGIFQSILVDLILLLRLVSVYPLARVGLKRFTLISGFPILLKVVRVTNVTIFLIITVGLVKKYGFAALNYYFSLPYLKIEWVAQVVDNTYASVTFLWTIRDRRPPTEYLSGSTIVVRSSVADRLRSLFRIALSNFVIPTLFSIIQLIVIFVTGGGLVVGDLIYANGMLSVYGVAFASVWAGKENRRNLEEARQVLNVGNWERNRPANDILEAGRSIGTTSSAMDLEVGSPAHVLDRTHFREAKPSPEVGPSLAKPEGQSTLPSPMTERIAHTADVPDEKMANAALMSSPPR